MNIKNLWFTFGGRASRSDYWVRTFLPLVGISFLLAIVAGLTDDGSGMSPMMLVYYAFSLFTILPSVAVSIKRFHDRNMSGWWLLLTFVPVLGWIFGLIFIGFLPGTDGDNDYGPNPVAASSAA
ncbi:MAG: DUF805 domain-containing protein [Alphaproteobacteria bacterium]|nr:MAG: DUF805 domain-containing protein [Alphaproteobacteria bacterium]